MRHLCEADAAAFALLAQQMSSFDWGLREDASLPCRPVAATLATVNAAPLLLALAVAPAHAGYSCRDLSDPEGRRWFQEQPCSPGYVHDPLPAAPLIHDAPRLPDDLGSPGSSWQVVGFDERGRTVGYCVRSGTAVPFVSTEAVRVTGPRGGRGGRRWR